LWNVHHGVSLGGHQPNCYRAGRIDVHHIYISNRGTTIPLI
jgi:hypothetical protein